MKRSVQMRIDSDDPEIGNLFKLANTKYAGDESVQMWVALYKEGTPNITIKRGRKKDVIPGIPPRSNFALKGLKKALRLREEGKVMVSR